ncbi:MAG: type IV pilus assembly protein PilM [Phycisphaerae bacterium]|nr:type IV pilus assembly protein PilM [Phycisphaerae bacterium]
MAASGAVWGIELGQCGLKALKLRQADDGVEVAAYEVIDHEKILSQPEANKEELIAAALKKFVEKTNVAGEKFVIGVPGQQTFARFCKLPPADPRRLGDLVRYEAEQQIPFDINDVVWDFQKFEDKDSPELEVGIFAMRKDLISKHLEYFNAVKIRPYMVQTVPSGIYNFARYENEAALKDGGALVVIDVGAQNTDLIIVESNRAWSRNIPLGGNAFTEALVRAFKLRFEKAEQLKRTAASSKYARQIFQAMRPVFAELVAEIQRSIGFYSSTHRDTELKQVLAVGNAFRLPGLQKYVENNLTIAGGVAKLEQLQRVKLAPEVDAAKFGDQILNLAAVTGLALQGLGQAKITADLLPPELARLAVWKRKQWWFAGTAAAAAVAALVPFAKNGLDSAALAAGSNNASQAEIDRIVNQARAYANEFNSKKVDTTAKEGEITKVTDILSKKRIIPGIVAVIHQVLPPLPPALAAAQTPEAFKAAIASDASLARQKRKQIIIEKLDLEFVPDVDNHLLQQSNNNFQGNQPQAAGDSPGFVANMQVRVTYGTSQSEVIDLITREYYDRLREFCQKEGLGFHIPLKDPEDPTKGFFNRNLNVVPAGKLSGGGGGAGGFPGNPVAVTPASESTIDPATGESTATDWSTNLAMKFKLGDAPPPPPPADGANPTRPPG